MINHPAVPDILLKLARDLEAGGFENFFLKNGAGSMHYAQILEETRIYGDNPLPGLFNEAVNIICENKLSNLESLRSSIINIDSNKKEKCNI